MFARYLVKYFSKIARFFSLDYALYKFKDYVVSIWEDF